MMKSDFYGCIMSLWGFSCHRSGVQGEGGRMFTWNFQYISKSRLSETLNQLNLNKYSGDIFIRIHTALHLPEEAVDLAQFIKRIVPKAQIVGTSCAAVIIGGRCAQNRCMISVSTLDTGKAQVKMLSLTDESQGTPLPVDMFCGQIKQELIKDNTKLLLCFSSGGNRDFQQFIVRCNDYFPGMQMIGGVACLPQTGKRNGIFRGFVFNETFWSDQALMVAALSGTDLESYTSYATGVQAVGQEIEVTDAFGSCMLSISNRKATDVFQMGFSGYLRNKPELLHMFPLTYSEAEDVPMLTRYEYNKSLEELFPKSDPENAHEYAIRTDLDTLMKAECLCVDYNVKIGQKIRRGFIYDGKIVSDNRGLFQRIENFVKCESLFAYSCVDRNAIYSDCSRWELSVYENSNISGCVLDGEIVHVNGQNIFGHYAFVISAIGEKPGSQEYNPYAFSHAECLSRDNEGMINFLMEIEGLAETSTPSDDVNRLKAFIHDCEKKILFSESDEIPNEAALSMDVRLKEYDRICIINVSEQAEMESVFSEHIIDLTRKNYIGKCLSFAKSKKYHIYLLDDWQIAIAESSYRVSLSKFIDDMSKLQMELFEYSEDFIAIVPIFCVLDGCTAENLQSVYYAARVEMLNKNVQFYVRDASDEADLDEDSIRERYHMINVINYAIMNDKVIPYFQGIYDNRKKKISHYESLMRLEDETGKIYYPNSFLDIARNFGVLYDAISKTMIKKVFERFRNEDKISVSINIGIRDIKNKEVLDLIFDNLSQVSHPENFIFEILENEDIEDYNEMVTFVDRVHELGGRIAIDDFGSGFSNLQHLLSIHTDFLKIDGSIIRNCCVNEDSASIIALITSFKSLASHNIGIVAEYVETEAIQEKLLTYGVDYSQGYLFSQPSPELNLVMEAETNNEV